MENVVKQDLSINQYTVVSGPDFPSIAGNFNPSNDYPRSISFTLKTANGDPERVEGACVGFYSEPDGKITVLLRCGMGSFLGVPTTKYAAIRHYDLTTKSGGTFVFINPPKNPSDEETKKHYFGNVKRGPTDIPIMSSASDMLPGKTLAYGSIHFDTADDNEIKGTVAGLEYADFVRGSKLRITLHPTMTSLFGEDTTKTCVVVYDLDKRNGYTYFVD